MTLRIHEYARNKIMALRSKGLTFVPIEKDLKENNCPISRQSISKFVHKFENSPFPLSQSLCMTRKERLTMEMYDFIDTQMENNNKLTSAGELWFVVCNSTNVALCSSHTSSHVLTLCLSSLFFDVIAHRAVQCVMHGTGKGLISWDQTIGQQAT